MREERVKQELDALHLMKEELAVQKKQLDEKLEERVSI